MINLRWLGNGGDYVSRNLGIQIRKKLGPSWAQLGSGVSGLIGLVPHLARHGLGPFSFSVVYKTTVVGQQPAGLSKNGKCFLPKKWHGLPRWEMIIHGNLGYPIFGKKTCKTMLLTSDGDGVYTLTACEQLLAAQCIWLPSSEFSPNAINHWGHLTRLGVQFLGCCSNYFWWRWGW